MHHAEKGHGFAFKPNVLQALIDIMGELAEQCPRIAAALRETEDRDIGKDSSQLNVPLNALAEDVILHGQRLSALLVRLETKTDQALQAPLIK